MADHFDSYFSVDSFILFRQVSNVTAFLDRGWGDVCTTTMFKLRAFEPAHWSCPSSSTLLLCLSSWSSFPCSSKFRVRQTPGLCPFHRLRPWELVLGQSSKDRDWAKAKTKGRATTITSSINASHNIINQPLFCDIVSMEIKHKIKMQPTTMRSTTTRVYSRCSKANGAPWSVSSWWPISTVSSSDCRVTVNSKVCQAWPLRWDENRTRARSPSRQD